MRNFEAIVIGAGPAGCAAAYDLADAGLRVLLLDKKSFPRLKPCAGALTIKAVKRVRYSIAPVIKWVARDLEVNLVGKRSRFFKSDHPIAVMTVRQEFDAYCLDQTLRKGVLFQPIADIAEISETQGGVTLTASGGERFHCGYLVGADGVNSRVRQLIGCERVSRAVALEGNISGDRRGGTPAMRFDFGYVPGGYGWVFPKGAHLNVGLYTQRPGTKFSKNDLVEYARYALGTDQIDRIIGYPVGIGGEKYQAKRQRIFLAGDAAGMTERLLGEGIHNALKTGQAAARAIVAAAGGDKSALEQYRTDLEEIQLDLKACRAAANWFYDLRFLGLARWFPVPRGAALMRGFAAGMTFRDIMRTCLISRSYPVELVGAVVEFEAAAKAAHAMR